jgi:hypothetical protein
MKIHTPRIENLTVPAFLLAKQSEQLQALSLALSYRAFRTACHPACGAITNKKL